MPTTFVMVKCDLGRAYRVADEAVRKVEEVSEVHAISGEFNLLKSATCRTRRTSATS